MRIFNQEKQFIFTWDHDYRITDNGDIRDLIELKNKANKNNKIFIFEKNIDGIVIKGIENLINKSDCLDYNGGYEEDSSAPKNKDKFCKYVINKINLGAILTNFKPFFDFIANTDKNHNL